MVTSRDRKSQLDISTKASPPEFREPSDEVFARAVRKIAIIEQLKAEEEARMFRRSRLLERLAEQPNLD